ncbi:HTH DNA binding domain-containing protein [Epibacterium ulvae]|uniref:HTH DNA binding domain-containing protein n=1 Tax=Epibacterium ulvae TaxID=1156985 RepID=A0A1G5RDZ3_9RHOB|nr:helix-turn-helix domain-containing protein [Epibacterium ulvae]SCZ71990.1 HTH DNA binding domain-containing protein [Epibacterium ulvae]
MKAQDLKKNNELESPFAFPNEDSAPSEGDLWFLPAPIEEGADTLPPGPRAEQPLAQNSAAWAQAEAGQAAHLARVAGRFGALDDRLQRGPNGWRHRLALMEVAELSWYVGPRISPDRLALWLALRLSAAQDTPQTLARMGWAVRRLTAGAGPLEDLATFLDRRDPEDAVTAGETFAGRAQAWRKAMAAGADLHPITQACMGFHLWRLAGLGPKGDSVEAAVTAVRIAASEGRGALFTPLMLGGADALRATGAPPVRLTRWLDSMEQAVLSAMRHLEELEAWEMRAEQTLKRTSGRTPPALRDVFVEWPLVSAPMAQTLTGSSRAAVQRNLNRMEAVGLIREVTGQGRFRMWTARV